MRFQDTKKQKSVQRVSKSKELRAKQTSEFQPEDTEALDNFNNMFDSSTSLQSSTLKDAWQMTPSTARGSDDPEPVKGKPKSKAKGKDAAAKTKTLRAWLKGSRTKLMAYLYESGKNTAAKTKKVVQQMISECDEAAAQLSAKGEAEVDDEVLGAASETNKRAARLMKELNVWV